MKLNIDSEIRGDTACWEWEAVRSWRERRNVENVPQAEALRRRGFGCRVKAHLLVVRHPRYVMAPMARIAGNVCLFRDLWFRVWRNIFVCFYFLIPWRSLNTSVACKWSCGLPLGELLNKNVRGLILSWWFKYGPAWWTGAVEGAGFADPAMSLVVPSCVMHRMIPPISILVEKHFFLLRSLDLSIFYLRNLVWIKHAGFSSFPSIYL